MLTHDTQKYKSQRVHSKGVYNRYLVYANDYGPLLLALWHDSGRLASHTSVSCSPVTTSLRGHASSHGIIKSSSIHLLLTSPTPARLTVIAENANAQDEQRS